MIFRAQIASRCAGTALTEAADLVRGEPLVEVTEGPLDLLGDLPQVRRLAEPEEEHRVAFDLGYLEAQLIGFDHHLEQLLDDPPAVVDLGLRDEPREAADVGNEQESPVFHHRLEAVGRDESGPSRMIARGAQARLRPCYTRLG